MSSHQALPIVTTGEVISGSSGSEMLSFRPCLFALRFQDLIKGY